MVGSWQYDISRINFNSGSGFVDLSTIIKSPIWHLDRVDVFVNYNSKRFLLSTLKYDDGSSYLSADIGFYLILQRGSFIFLLKIHLYKFIELKINY